MLEGELADASGRLFVTWPGTSMTMSSAVMPPTESASRFAAQPLAVSLYAVSMSRARFLTTLPQMKSSG